MQANSQIWMTILGFISLSITLSIVTHFWIRYHLKNKSVDNLNNAPNATSNSANTSDVVKRQDDK